jgi:hypothetical protein
MIKALFEAQHQSVQNVRELIDLRDVCSRYKLFLDSLQIEHDDLHVSKLYALEELSKTLERIFTYLDQEVQVKIENGNRVRSKIRTKPNRLGFHRKDPQDPDSATFPRQQAPGSAQWAKAICFAKEDAAQLCKFRNEVNRLWNDLNVDYFLYWLDGRKLWSDSHWLGDGPLHPDSRLAKIHESVLSVAKIPESVCAVAGQDSPRPVSRVFIHGRPGVGKTCTCISILRLESVQNAYRGGCARLLLDKDHYARSLLDCLKRCVHPGCKYVQPDSPDLDDVLSIFEKVSRADRRVFFLDNFWGLQSASSSFPLDRVVQRLASPGSMVLLAGPSEPAVNGKAMSFVHEIRPVECVASAYDDNLLWHMFVDGWNDKTGSEESLMTIATLVPSILSETFVCNVLNWCSGLPRAAYYAGRAVCELTRSSGKTEEDIVTIFRDSPVSCLDPVNSRLPADIHECFEQTWRAFQASTGPADMSVEAYRALGRSPLIADAENNDVLQQNDCPFVRVAIEDLYKKMDLESDGFRLGLIIQRLGSVFPVSLHGQFVHMCPIMHFHAQSLVQAAQEA